VKRKRILQAFALLFVLIAVFAVAATAQARSYTGHTVETQVIHFEFCVTEDLGIDAEYFLSLCDYEGQRVFRDAVEEYFLTHGDPRPALFYSNSQQ
jgi:hypothetical protein